LVDHAIGSGTDAVDFFIAVCLDAEPTEHILALLESSQPRGILTCKALLPLERWLNATTGRDLYNRMTALCTAISHVPGSCPLDPFFMQEIVDMVEGMVEQAQGEFLNQLQKDEGEAFGLKMHELATVIGKNEAVRIHFPSDGRLLRLVAGLPPRDTLQVIFKQLKAFSDSWNSQSGGSSRMKTYLSQTLGGEGDPEPSVVAMLPHEVRFWRGRPGTARVEIARQIAATGTVSYQLYISCLEQMMKEQDLVIQDMKPTLKAPRNAGIPDFAKYLAERRRTRLAVHECWVSLLVSLINEEGGVTYMVAASDVLSGAAWLQFLEDLRLLVGLNNGALTGGAGPGLSREMMSWLDLLQDRYRKAVEFLTRMSGFDGKVRWVFEGPRDDVTALLEECREPERLGDLQRQVFAFLGEDGQNVSLVSRCLAALKQASPLGHSLCHNMVARMQDASRWPHPLLEAMAAVLHGSATLPIFDRVAFESICNILGLQRRIARGSFPLLLENLVDGFGNLIDTARSLESLRMQLRHINAQRTRSLLQSVGIEETRGGGSCSLSPEVASDALADAVEEVGPNEYEMVFALTSLSEAQRKARGVPPRSRSVVVRVTVSQAPRFSIQLPDYDGDEPTILGGWNVNQGLPTTPPCTTRPAVFTRHLSKCLVSILSGRNASLPSIFDAVTAAIRDPPAACLGCGASMPQRWAPTMCSRNCSRAMRLTPLEIRLGPFIIEPAVADLLLTCAYVAAADNPPAGLDLLPGCPVPRDRLIKVIDSFPAMSGLATAADIRQFIRGSNTDGMAQHREDLMSWLGLYFRGFMMEATGSYLTPSMPGTRQFVVLNSPPEREAQFSPGQSGPVFHGTQPSRLLAILGGGLRSMTGRPGQANGAAYGPGVYCGDNPHTSLGFCGSTGTSWRNSTLGNRSVLLGCELASYTGAPRGGIHVIQQDTRLLVRYVFLLPPHFLPPGRHHVDTALSSVFVRIRTSM
jgi:hypothetical protein